ncbi:hypothetical protein CVT24_006728 [Panaeolus cyanescens]|uniref:Uncharacterized protein n=1 Tax=Panaeolus cyanescens TaxID=181874 RepID=A0A409VD25_9AGAR|nr:hypothetical protein CVT24_006728 [Panaeolus cyanescens]
MSLPVYTAERQGLTVWAENSESSKYPILKIEDHSPGSVTIRVGVPRYVSGRFRNFSIHWDRANQLFGYQYCVLNAKTNTSVVKVSHNPPEMYVWMQGGADGGRNRYSSRGEYNGGWPMLVQGITGRSAELGEVTLRVMRVQNPWIIPAKGLNVRERNTSVETLRSLGAPIDLEEPFVTFRFVFAFTSGKMGLTALSNLPGPAANRHKRAWPSRSLLGKRKRARPINVGTLDLCDSDDDVKIEVEESASTAFNPHKKPRQGKFDDILFRFIESLLTQGFFSLLVPWPSIVDENSQSSVIMTRSASFKQRSRSILSSQPLQVISDNTKSTRRVVIDLTDDSEDLLYSPDTSPSSSKITSNGIDVDSVMKAAFKRMGDLADEKGMLKDRVLALVKRDEEQVEKLRDFLSKYDA